MAQAWFRPWGWIYRPVSAVGWLAVLLTAMFCGQVFVAIDRHSHSASDTLYGCYPYFVSTFLLWTWLADRTSRQ